MTEKTAEWYIPGKSDAPNGPMTEDDVFSRYRNGLINEGTLCWRIGMDEWLPLSQVEPFSAAINLEHEVPREIRFHCSCGSEIVLAEKFAGQSVHCKACGKTVVVPQPEYAASPPVDAAGASEEETSTTGRIIHSWKAVAGIAFACVLVIGVVMIWIMPSRWAINEGEQLLVVGNYSEAVRVLRDFVADHPRHHHGAYLYGLALLNEYAVTQDEHDHTLEDVLGGNNPLEEAGIMFGQALDRDQELLERARVDLSDTASRVPGLVGDRLARQVAICELQSELGLIDRKQMGHELLSQSVTRRPWVRQPPSQALVMRIVDCDPSLIGEVIGLMLPEGGMSISELTRSVETLEGWGQADRAIGDALAEVFLRRGEALARDTEYEKMEIMLAAAGRSDPGLMPEVAKLRIAALRTRLEAGDIIDVVHQLDRTGSESAAMRSAVIGLYLDVARRYADNRQYKQAEQVVGKAIVLDPAGADAAYRVRLEILSERLTAGDVEDVLRILDQTREEMRGHSERMADLYLEAARLMSRDNPKRASIALAQAFQLDARLTASEQNALLAIQFHEQVDLDKLGLCQDFLKQHPDSSRCPQVLLTIVSDTAELIGGRGRQEEIDTDSLVAAGAAAANELLNKHSTVAGLDSALLGFCQALMSHNRGEKAAGISRSLLGVVPDTPLKPEYERLCARWRESQGLGTLPVAMDDQVASVAEEYEQLKRMLAAPVDLSGLCQGDDVARIIEVARACTADKFDNQQVDMLKQWVSDGGVLLANNDVLSLFGIEFKPVSSRRRMGGECSPAVAPEICPVLELCERVTVSTTGGVIELIHEDAIPLLMAKGNPRSGTADYAIWSLVKYGDGLISDVKDVALDKHDGARFWLNFRHFCLGRSVVDGGETKQPDKPRTVLVETEENDQGVRLAADPVDEPTEPVATEPPPEFQEITTAEELEHALTVLDQHRVLWIRLSKQEVGADALKKLRAWVRSGGVLWLDTDLVRSFGFTFGSSELREAPPNRETGVAEVFLTQHQITEGLNDQQLSYTLSASRLLVAHKQGGKDKYLTPLLGWAASTRKEPELVLLVCAIRNNGEGVVLYRPATIDTRNQAGEQFERNLRDWSVERAVRVLTPATP